jgi:ribosome-binding protein aMBF1 (putative translation factor)
MKTMKCEICGKEIQKRNSRQKYCIRCGNIANREKTKERQNKKGR